MIKVTETKQMEQITQPKLKDYLTSKAESLMNEYSVNSLENIGCFVVLEKDEYTDFEVKAMEFVNIVRLENEVYLHGVKVLSDDGYGEDTYLEIEVE